MAMSSARAAEGSIPIDSPAVFVTVFPFVRQPQGDDVVIGHAESGTYLALPAEAVEALDLLASGLSIEEAKAAYHERHGETPDLEDLVRHLEARGFLSVGEPTSEPAPLSSAPRAGTPARRYHFATFPQALAARLFGRRALLAARLIILAGVVAAVLEPQVIPGRSAVIFAEHRALKILVLSLLSYLTLFLHEMAHLVAARAVGANSRMAISQRLWVLVAETDLSNLWSVPKEKRYIPLVAGPILDAVLASLLILFLVAQPRLLAGTPMPVVQMARAILFVSLMRLLWQCFFFVRTDFYYVIATYFDCKNLMGDVRRRLKRALSFLVPAWRDVEAVEMPEREERVVRLYSMVWVLGRSLAILLFIFVALPITWRYVRDVSSTLGQGYSSAPYAFLDALAFAVFLLTPTLLALVLWLRRIYLAMRKTP